LQELLGEEVEEEQEGRSNIAKKITYPWQTMRKNNSELLNCFVFVFVFFNFFGVELFSEVRTSNLLHRSWDFLHSGLMLQQLSHLTD